MRVDFFNNFVLSLFDTSNFTISAIRREKRTYLQYISSLRNPKLLWNNLNSLNIFKKNKNVNLPAHLADVNEINNHFFSFMSVNEADSTLINFYGNNTYNHEKFSFTLLSVADIASLSNLNL